jgi:hypothetical protein
LKLVEHSLTVTSIEMWNSPMVVFEQVTKSSFHRSRIPPLVTRS